jgi:hypothetical protein
MDGGGECARAAPDAGMPEMSAMWPVSTLVDRPSGASPICN